MIQNPEVIRVRAERRALQKARQLWRIGAATELCCATNGCNVVVADILHFAAVSRKTFYEFFRSRDHAISVFNRAAKVTSRYTTVPAAPWMEVFSHPGGYTGDDLADLFRGAHAIVLRDDPKPRELPANGSFLLKWAARVEAILLADAVTSEPEAGIRSEAMAPCL